MKTRLLLTAVLASSIGTAFAQQAGKPEDTEVYEPVPPVVMPGKMSGEAPSDAIILFDGKNLNEWVLTEDHDKPAPWTVSGGILTVKKDAGNIETKRTFTNYQLHLEWRVPANI